MKKIDRRKALQYAAYIAGGTLSGSIIAGVMSGCKTDPTVSMDAFKPKFLSVDQHRLLAEATERILPATDSPGAKDAKVSQFIDLMLKDVYKEEEQKDFITGLDALEADAKASHNKAFADCAPKEMDALLTKAMQQEDASFFETLKQLTITGFFTSEEGATKVLNFKPVPGEWRGCMPLEELGGKAWAT